MNKLKIFILLLFFSVFLISCDNQEIDKLNGRYNGELIYQYSSISSWVTNFDVEIKDNLLSMNGEEIGLLEKKEINSLEWITDHLYFEEEYESLINNLKQIKECYSVDIKNDKQEDFITSAMIFEYLNEKYLIFGLLDQDSVSVIKGYYLSNYAVLDFTDYPGGCIVLNHTEKVKMGTTYDLSYVESILGASQYIDLETLEIYQKEIKVVKNLDLVTYNNGVYDIYIKRYLNSKSSLMHIYSKYDLQLLEDYDCTKDEDGNYIVINDDVTYLFKASEQLENYYYLSNIKGKKIFNDLSYQETIDVLKILYGSDAFNKYLISINISEESFEINLNEEALNG